MTSCRIQMHGASGSLIKEHCLHAVCLCKCRRGEDAWGSISASAVSLKAQMASGHNKAGGWVGWRWGGGIVAAFQRGVKYGRSGGGRGDGGSAGERGEGRTEECGDDGV